MGQGSRSKAGRGEGASSELSPEKIYEHRWALTVLDQALARLADEFAAAGRSRQFELLKGFLEDETTSGDYNAIAAQCKMTPAAVAMAVSRLRQRYREILLAEIGRTVDSASEAEEELRYLFTALNN
jgi:hypothetical protein